MTMELKKDELRRMLETMPRSEIYKALMITKERLDKYIEFFNLQGVRFQGKRTKKNDLKDKIQEDMFI